MADLASQARRKLHLLVSPPKGQQTHEDFLDYEAGKRRRYELLFAVNGGAFALVGWLTEVTKETTIKDIKIGGLSVLDIGVGMAAIVAIMCLDLFAFGLRFRAIFGQPGKLFIVALSTLLIAGWLLAGSALGPVWVIPLSLLIAVSMASLACLSARMDQQAATLTMYTLDDRIRAHSNNAAHATEISPNSRLLFCNGQVGARLDGTVPADRREQIEVIFERIRIILAASSMTFEDVVKFTVYVTDKSILDDYFSVRGRFMGDHNPPATLLVVDGFPRSGVEIEIEAVAAKA